MNEELSQLSLEMRAVQENMETLEAKNDFIEAKISKTNAEIINFPSPDDIDQL